MNKIVQIQVNDLILDYRAASDMVNNACSRQRPMKVVGLYRRGAKVMLFLEELEDRRDDLAERRYVFSAFPDPSEEGVVAEAQVRYFSGFRTLGCFEVGDQVWGLFERKF